MSKHWWVRGLGCLAVLLSTSVAFPQAGWNVRQINSRNQITPHYEAWDILSGGLPMASAWTFVNGNDVAGEIGPYDTVDFAGNGAGTFGDNWDLPDTDAGFATNRNDYILSAWAEVTIPAGNWSIAFGTDDGGQITVPGANFTSVFNANDPNNRALDTDGNGVKDQIFFNADRGHGWTGGQFVVPAGGMTAIIHSSFHERGGGDSFEVAIRNNPGGATNNTVSSANGWSLLGDGVEGWDVSSDAAEPFGGPGASTGGVASVGGFYGQYLPPTVVKYTYASVADSYTPGLTQHWSRINNPGNLSAILNGQIVNGLVVPPFQNDPSWHTGNQGAGTDVDIERYPPQVEAGGMAVGTSANNEQYSVRWTGEMRFDRNGDYKFRNGIDDFTYMAIDLNRSGVAGDAISEVLYQDNAWVNVDASRGAALSASLSGENMSTEQTVTVAGVTADEATQWLAVDIVMSEGGGGDAGIIYWDNNGRVADFPTLDAGVPRAVIEDVMVPQSHLRSKLPGAVTGAEVSAQIGSLDSVNLRVSSKFLDGDKVLINNPDPTRFTTTLDVAGATVNVIADGDLVAGDEWVLFAADNITGLESLNLVFADPAQWDTSGLAGPLHRIRFVGAGTVGDFNGDGVIDSADLNLLGADAAAGTNTPTYDLNSDNLVNTADRDVFLGGNIITTGNKLNGDADFNGTVEFPDFVVLAGNFGNPGVWSGGDFDVNGAVAFPDFVILADNFGKTAGAAAAAVPEPAGLALLGLGGLLFGLARRRR
jgi:hypothetical protein